MGAKYLPTVKDQKASLRFQRKQAAVLKAKKVDSTIRAAQAGADQTAVPAKA